MSIFQRFRSNLRRNIVAGLVTVLPLSATIFLLLFLYRKAEGFFSPLVKQFFKIRDLPYPPEFITTFLGILLSIVGLYFIGVFAANYVGKKLLGWGESILNRIPLVRSVYTTVKQILETFSVDTQRSFAEVVLLEYPRKGLWSFGFVTSKQNPVMDRLIGEKIVVVFIPSTPNPTTGYILHVLEREIIRVNISPDYAFKYIISAGVLSLEEDKLGSIKNIHQTDLAHKRLRKTSQAGKKKK